MLSGLGDDSAAPPLGSAALPARRDAVSPWSSCCRVSRCTTTTPFVVFQADRRAGLGDHQRIVANGGVHHVLFLVALSADESALTIIPSCVHLLLIFSARRCSVAQAVASRRRIKRSAHNPSCLLSAAQRPDKHPWHVHVPSPPYHAAPCGPFRCL